MYRIDGAAKRDLERRWALPDRVFFACGACHILAYAFMERYPEFGFRAVWLKPKPGLAGDHIIAVKASLAFDYHGYSNGERCWPTRTARPGAWWPGWDAELVELAREVLISEERSRAYDGGWLKEPG